MSVRHHYASLAIVSLSFAGLLIGCASPQQQPYGAVPQSQNYDRVASYTGTGVVEAIEVTHKESNGVAGTVVGGVAGGLVGNAIGGGTGRVLATVAGAAGGAYAGNKIQRNNSEAARSTTSACAWMMARCRPSPRKTIPISAWVTACGWIMGASRVIEATTPQQKSPPAAGIFFMDD